MARLRSLAAKALSALDSYSSKWQTLPSYEKIKADTLNTKWIRTPAAKKFAFFASTLLCALYFLVTIFTYSDEIRLPHAKLGSAVHALNKNQLLLSMNHNASLVKAVQQGSLYHLDEEESRQSWRRPFTFSDPFSMAQVPLDSHRCPVYTYFDHDTSALRNATSDPKKLARALDELKTEEKIVETWARAWWALGFNPIVLNKTDAMDHPRYDEFMSSNVFDTELKLANRKWLAWLAAGAGIYSDYRVIPVTRDATHEAVKFLKACQYKERFAFDDRSLSLIVSDIKDTKPFLFDIMRGYSEQELSVNFEVYDQDAFAYYSNRNFRTVTNTLKGGARADKLAINDAPISAEDILIMMNAHLRQAFLDAYPNGIAFAAPSYDPMSKIIAHTLAECPKTRLAGYCPPTHSTLHNLAIGKSNTHRKPFHLACRPRACSSAATANGVRVVTLDGLVQPSRQIFTVASLVHPWTNLALKHMTHNGTDATIDDVREYPTRDELVRGLTTSLFDSEAVGPDLRLLALKDSMAQASFASNVSWILFDTDNATQIEAVSRDIGFDLEFDEPVFGDMARAQSYGGLQTYLRAEMPIIDAFLASTSAQIANDLLGTDYLTPAAASSGSGSGSTAQVYEAQPAFEATKTWNPADYEAWRFLHRLDKYKSAKWAALKTQFAVIDEALAINPKKRE